MIRSVFKHPQWRFALGRYLLVVPTFAELLLYSRILGPDDYGLYGYVLQLVGLSTILTLGSGAGYLHATYNKSREDIDEVYLAGSLVHFIGAATLAGLVLCLFNPILALSVPLFLIQAPHLMLEPMLRVRNRFTLSLLGKFSSSIISVGLLGALVLFYPETKVSWSTGVALMLVSNTLGFGLYYLVVRQLNLVRIPVKQVARALASPKTYTHYIKSIVSPAGLYMISSMSYFLFTFVDRIFLESYRSAEELSVYVLSFQLLQGALVLLESNNTVISVRIGEQLDSPDLPRIMRQYLRDAFLICLGVWSAYLAGGYLLSRTVYSDFPNMFVIMACLSVGYMIQGIAGANTNFLFLRSKFGWLIGTSLFCLLASVVGNCLALHYNWWHGVAVMISSGSLAIVNLCLLGVLYFREIPRSALSQGASSK